MLTCSNCGASIKEGYEYERLGRILCEDCYLDALNPPRACDPWAVHTARQSLGRERQLTPLQNNIISLLKDQGPLTAEELLSHLGVSESEIRSALATLRHMELSRACKVGDRICHTLFAPEKQ